jgi:hypothetical protein
MVRARTNPLPWRCPLRRRSLPSGASGSGISQGLTSARLHGAGRFSGARTHLTVLSHPVPQLCLFVGVPGPEQPAIEPILARSQPPFRKSSAAIAAVGQRRTFGTSIMPGQIPSKFCPARQKEPRDGAPRLLLAAPNLLGCGRCLLGRGGCLLLLLLGLRSRAFLLARSLCHLSFLLVQSQVCCQALG